MGPEPEWEEKHLERIERAALDRLERQCERAICQCAIRERSAEVCPHDQRGVKRISS